MSLPERYRPDLRDGGHALRVALALLVPGLVLIAWGRPELLIYAEFGAFAGMYGRGEQGRPRIVHQVQAGGLLIALAFAVGGIDAMKLRSSATLFAAVPGANGDDLVNGLTTAFCQAGRDDPGYAKAGWHATIGSFASIAYSQLRNPEKRASNGSAPRSP